MNLTAARGIKLSEREQAYNRCPTLYSLRKKEAGPYCRIGCHSKQYHGKSELTLKPGEPVSDCQDEQAKKQHRNKQHIPYPCGHQNPYEQSEAAHKTGLMKSLST